MSDKESWQSFAFRRYIPLTSENFKTIVALNLINTMSVFSCHYISTGYWAGDTIGDYRLLYPRKNVQFLYFHR